MLAAGGNLDAVSQEYKDKYRLPEAKGVEQEVKPRKCSFVELLIEEKADVTGVADTYLGTSWLHEVVR